MIWFNIKALPLEQKLLNFEDIALTTESMGTKVKDPSLSAPCKSN